MDAYSLMPGRDHQLRHTGRQLSHSGGGNARARRTTDREHSGDAALLRAEPRRQSSAHRFDSSPAIAVRHQVINADSRFYGNLLASHLRRERGLPLNSDVDDEYIASQRGESLP